ncbi:hypothetical protein SAMN05216548_11225 [Faunimonas pinastri]|uniref:Uncharacterized protein n=1 Tax=Faunimonas pinastri TaxID=1855383 RepID=A0A1H9LUG1_9HYPH|nr:hypothetical protein [Faunimonas pinastri]SER15076.1 hypothetical protein SAMN05216548_11225 [Faunimonas pinastri]
MGALMPRQGGLFERVPERLVLQGFRLWTAGYVSGDLKQWDDVWTIYTEALGGVRARPLVEHLAQWVASIRAWSVGPIRCFPGSCPHICRDECFALATISASQNEDLDCLAAAMGSLVDPEGIEQTMRLTVAYAEAMKENGLRLMPVPCCVIQEIAGRPPVEKMH